jgi:hypothetical protein
MAIKYAKWQENRPNGHTYTNIFHCKTFQNFPIWDFWFEKKPSGNPGEKRFLQPTCSTCAMKTVQIHLI